MAQAPILTEPNPILRTRSSEIEEAEFGTPELSKLCTDLLDTLRAEPNGAGMASPQIGVAKRAIAVQTPKGPQVFLNPVITSKSWRMVESEEGCFSVPGVFGIVKRHRRVKLEARDVEGRHLELSVSAFPSVVFQHEIDHLDGILFTDKVIRYTRSPEM